MSDNVFLVARLGKGWCTCVGSDTPEKRFPQNSALKSILKSQQVRAGAREGEECSKQRIHGLRRGFELSEPKSPLEVFSFFFSRLFQQGAQKKMKAFSHPSVAEN